MPRPPRRATEIGVLIGAVISSILVVVYALSEEPMVIVLAGVPTAVGLLTGAWIDRHRQEGTDTEPQRAPPHTT
jgi:hypothetical protein